MLNKDFIKGFMTAAGLLPERLWRGVFTLSEHERELCEEIRLRLGRPLIVSSAGKHRVIQGESGPLVVTRDEIDEVLARVTGSSVHTYNDQIAVGFITAENGHRLGLCGDVTQENGSVRTMRAFSSVNLRVAKQALGLSEQLCRNLYEQGFASTLILAPPGAGKTTLLRDMARRLSHRFNVSVVDERHEIAACRQGVPQFDLGRCDVLSGANKAAGIEMLLRGMSPEIIALDEITSAQDVRTLAAASYSGCTFLTTAHGGGVDDLSRRPVYREAFAQGIFDCIILIENKFGRRSFRVWRESHDKNDWADNDSRVMLGDRYFNEQEAEGPR